MLRYAAAMLACCLAFLPAQRAFAADVGPAADVSAVRAAENAAWAASGSAGGAPLKIETIRVVAGYAVLEWVKGESGGMSAYHRTSSGAWKRFMHGGGAFGAKDLEANGCPAAVARQLMPGSPG